MNENHEQGYLDLERFLAFEPRNLGSSLRSAGSQLCDLDAFCPGYILQNARVAKLSGTMFGMQ